MYRWGREKGWRREKRTEGGGEREVERKGGRKGKRISSGHIICIQMLEIKYIHLVLCYFSGFGVFFNNIKAKVSYHRTKHSSPIQSVQIPNKNRVIFNNTNQVFSWMYILRTVKMYSSFSLLTIIEYLLCKCSVSIRIQA